jgi:pyruvate/2-oxoglutarate dehydrogenase complex dihydrolipoamide acyltransferase (E2) component
MMEGWESSGLFLERVADDADSIQRPKHYHEEDKQGMDILNALAIQMARERGVDLIQVVPHNRKVEIDGSKASPGHKPAKKDVVEHGLTE